ncbi:hypothetical protein P885DRAFT_41236 [Corynascus similis CBS 632.67]
MPDAFHLGTGPQQLWGADATPAPGQALYGVPLGSPVDQDTAGSFQSDHRPLLLSTVVPPQHTNHGTINQWQPQPNTVCYHQIASQTLLAEPPYLGTEVRSPAHFVQGLDGVSSASSAGRLVPDNQQSYRTLAEETGVVGSLGDIRTLRFDHVTYVAGNTVFGPRPSSTTPLSHLSDSSIVSFQTAGLASDRRCSKSEQQPNHVHWITKKHSHPTAGVGEEPDFNENQLDSEGPRDRKKRARFEENLRRQTSNTRIIGACLRCHNQRVRCVPNNEEADPLAPCETCRKVRRDSKKTIHSIPCVRFKVTSMTIYRAGGLGYTKRFDHTKLVDIVDYGDKPIEISITQGLCSQPLRLMVRRFKPKETDRTHWSYLDNGILVAQDTGAFCLADIEKTAKEFNIYVERYALEGLKNVGNESDEIVSDVFRTIVALCESPSAVIKSDDGKRTKGVRKHLDQKDFLLKIVRLWFAIRHGTGSAWLYGDETLGLRPGSGPNDPHRGKILVSRMIVAQFDSIRHERIYKKLVPEVLRAFDTFLASCNKEAWFTVFLATFLLLHQVARTSQDRRRHTKQNSGGRQLDTRYGNLDNPLTGFVEEVHHSAVMLLAHWQYFKRCDLINFKWVDIGESALMFLEPDQLECLKRTVHRLKEKLPLIPTTPDTGCWENELYWISKMFVSDTSEVGYWKPPEIFTRAKPSVGRE